MKLWAMMQEKGYSTRELAKKADISTGTLSFILYGRNGKPYLAGPGVRRKICDVLKCEPRDIDEFAAAIDDYIKKENRRNNVELAPAI